MIDRIVIVGGGTAGWMTAAALSAKLGGTVAIHVVESEAIGTVGVGEATIPHIRHFNAALGIDEAEFMAATGATYKLGIEFRDWGRRGDSYVHPFSSFGEPIGEVPFHQHWVRARKGGTVPPFDAFSPGVQAGRSGSFAGPGRHAGASYNHAYHFDAALYGAFLRELAERRGVRRTEGRVVDVARDGETGFVRSVVLEDGRAVHGDLFVDCSGFRGLLIEQTLASGYEDWREWLPCDRAVALPCAAAQRPLPLTRATATEAGWTWRIPLQHRVGNGHVYSSDFMEDERALELLLRAMESAPAVDPNRLRFVPGKRRRQWVGNTVAIGLAAGFLEPLESTSIHLIQLAIGHLLDLLPQGSWEPADATEFNRLMDLHYDRVRDFIILHYHASGRDDSPFWRHVRSVPPPDTLAYKLELFRERGAVVEYRDGTFLEPSWLAVYLGQHVLPGGHDPRADIVPLEHSVEHFSRMADAYRRAAVGAASAMASG